MRLWLWRLLGKLLPDEPHDCWERSDLVEWTAADIALLDIAFQPGNYAEDYSPDEEP